MKNPAASCEAAGFGGGCEIRTREGVNPTRFPSERHRPLGESSIGQLGYFNTVLFTCQRKLFRRVAHVKKLMPVALSCIRAESTLEVRSILPLLSNSFPQSYHIE